MKDSRCNLVQETVQTNETVESCRRPLHRICPHQQQRRRRDVEQDMSRSSTRDSQFEEDIRSGSARDTLQGHLKSLTYLLGESLKVQTAILSKSGRKLSVEVKEDLGPSGEDKECHIFYETVCQGEKCQDNKIHI